jgi:uncharacterized protein (TIGR02300 family)
VAKPELGVKRQCQSCATKFYDLNKVPIVCPKCGEIFHAAPLARVVAPPADEEEEVEKSPVDTVSLDEAEAAESKSDAIDVDEDVDIDDDGDVDDTFLAEEEEEDDDVTGLIDGDLESDEEG